MSTQVPDRDGASHLARSVRTVRSHSNPNVDGRILPPPLAPTTAAGPGGFSTELKSVTPRGSEFPRHETEQFPGARWVREEEEEEDEREQRKAGIRDQIEKETKIKMGTENLLEALHAKNPKHTREQRLKVESELATSNKKIALLRQGLEAEIQRSKETSPTRAGRLTTMFRNAPSRSPSAQNANVDPFNDETESPTFLLAEILQSLETDGLEPDYYVQHANRLVELFKRHPLLKYDLVWSIFGLRVQVMLLDNNAQVVAAGYRMMRYAITDLKSLSIIRSLHTDQLVILSLVKDSKASIEREQALKFVRAFLDVKGGINEIPRSIVRVIVAVAEHHDDRMRNMCILTLSEILIRKPSLIISAGGMRILTEALAEGSYQPAESLTAAFLYLMDVPKLRCYLCSGQELTGPFSAFTDSTVHSDLNRLRSSAKVIGSILKTWSGLMTLAADDFIAIKSLVTSLYTTTTKVRDIILELIFDIMRIKPPSWSSSYLAGRRLTTYGRVGHMRTMSDEEARSLSADELRARDNLVNQFIAASLSILLYSGLPNGLLFVIQNETDPSVRRRSTLLLGETLHLADRLLPNTKTEQLHLLPSLFLSASDQKIDDRFAARRAIYQIDSVNRTLHRTGKDGSTALSDFENAKTRTGRSSSDAVKGALNAQIEEGPFRSVVMETQVLNTVNFAKWRWEIIEKIIDGPLMNPKRLDEATRAMKFVKRLLSFYRPFKYRFSDIRNTKPNQRYVRIGCSLIRALLQTSEGVRYLAEDKLLIQIAECLAQVDRTSGLTSPAPLFSAERLTETLSGGYFALLGTLSANPRGLAMMERWKMANMFYHIVELNDREDLIKGLLGRLDYSLDSHLRIILSKVMTASNPTIRIYATRLLRPYTSKKETTDQSPAVDETCVAWALSLLITQLYDPDLEVCEVGVKLLEEACDDPDSLKFIVRSAPALDHLGEIGAPLLLRFLSTSIGYHYLDELDYISQEMDDWFLGRNDAYVTQVEASLSKALNDTREASRSSIDDVPEPLVAVGYAPPHFYRELTRTAEGCRLLAEKGHFMDFVSLIKSSGLESTDPEIMLKVKGSLWAVGNIGSMDLGAPFFENSDVVSHIINIAQQATVLSMRGTAFFVLGLISRSVYGQELLAEQGWDSTVDAMGNSLGICLPQDLTKLFSGKSWSSAKSDHEDIYLAATEGKHKVTDDDPLNTRILTLVYDLGNSVLTKARASELHSIRAKKAAAFHQTKMFHKVMSILEQHHFRLPALRFVIDLFDKDVMKRLVLDEESDEDTEIGPERNIGTAS